MATDVKVRKEHGQPLLRGHGPAHLSTVVKRGLDETAGSPAAHTICLLKGRPLVIQVLRSAYTIPLDYRNDWESTVGAAASEPFHFI